MKNAPVGAFFLLPDRCLNDPRDMRRHQGSMMEIPLIPA
jgi:hypothetical protein